MPCGASFQGSKNWNHGFSVPSAKATATDRKWRQRRQFSSCFSSFFGITWGVETLQQWGLQAPVWAALFRPPDAQEMACKQRCHPHSEVLGLGFWQDWRCYRREQVNSLWPAGGLLGVQDGCGSSDALPHEKRHLMSVCLPPWLL